MVDIEKVVRQTEPIEPFRQDSQPLNVVTGVRASSSLNVDDAKSKGEKILKDMEAKSVGKYVFRRKEKAVTMTEKSSAVIDSEREIVEPALIFRRLAAVAKTSGSDLNKVLSFKLCTFPPSLFSSFEVLKTADKASLTNALMKIEEIVGPVTLPASQRVLDGGWLVHKIPWIARTIYSKVAESYVDYVKRHFGQAVVDFESYTDKPTTKNCTELKRTKVLSCPNIEFSPNMKMVKSKEKIFISPKNKQHFIGLLTERLANSGGQVLHAQDDADVLVVQTALSCAETLSTTLIGNDTDLLVLLLYHTKLDACNIFMQTDTHENNRRLYDTKRIK